MNLPPQITEFITELGLPDTPVGMGIGITAIIVIVLVLAVIAKKILRWILSLLLLAVVAAAAFLFFTGAFDSPEKTDQLSSQVTDTLQSDHGITLNPDQAIELAKAGKITVTVDGKSYEVTLDQSGPIPVPRVEIR